MLRIWRWRILTVIAILIAIAIVYLNNPSRFQGEAALGIIAVGSTRVGESAPDFALKDPDGKVVKLSDYRGQKVLVNFWAAWCSTCKVEMPYFEQVHQQGEVVVLGINVQESASDVQRFLEEELRVTYPLLLDPTGEVSLGYNLFAMPTSFFIDESGRIWGRKFGLFVKEEFEQRITEFTRS
ncbi:MAG: TlpA family protein disulfide reductase [Candidatus Bipolaricaulia bacterium]